MIIILLCIIHFKNSLPFHDFPRYFHLHFSYMFKFFLNAPYIFLPIYFSPQICPLPYFNILSLSFWSIPLSFFWKKNKLLRSVFFFSLSSILYLILVPQLYNPNITLLCVYWVLLALVNVTLFCRIIYLAYLVQNSLVPVEVNFDQIW